jgi:hypothetical protein
VQVRIFFLFLTMLMRGVSGRSKPMSVGCCTGTHRFRVLMEIILL